MSGLKPSADHKTKEEHSFLVEVDRRPYELLPEKIYLARLDGMPKQKNSVYGQYYEIPFRVEEDGKFVECPINGIFGNREGMWKLIRALTGMVILEKTKVAMKSLIGKKCYIKVEQRTTNGRFCNAITDYYSLEEGKKFTGGSSV